MKRILLTGMSGTGKSSVIAALAALGHPAVDLDEDGFSELVAVDGDELTGPGGGQDWVWRGDRVRDLLATDHGAVLFLGGCAPNQGTFYAQLDQVVLLSAPPDVIVERLASRTTNPFGKRPGEIERVLELQRTIEPLLRRGADHEIDTSRPLGQVVAEVLRLVGHGDDAGAADRAPDLDDAANGPRGDRRVEPVPGTV